MAVAVRRGRKKAQTGLKMNALFFGLSMVMLVVMGVSMWKDTHPEWRAYQERFAVIERKTLLAQEAELLRQLRHPDYDGDYVKARQQYDASKGAFDAAVAALDGTEAELEELDLQAKSSEPSSEEGATAAPEPAAKLAAAAKPAKASADEMAELDKEFGGAAKPPKPAPKPAKPQTPTPTKSSGPSKDELAELDKEFKDTPAPKASKAPTAGGAKVAKQTPSAPAKPPEASKDELAELDKEFKDTPAPKVSKAPTATLAEAPKPASAPTFEEADLILNQKGAEAQVEAAHRDLLAAERRHSKEMIALPKEEDLKRRLAEARLKEAQQSLAVATQNLDLEKKKEGVKNAALVAKWARDTELLKSGKAADSDRKRLDESAQKLVAHVSDLNRDLRLVEGRLDRNRTLAPEIQQVYIERLGIVDRCGTCHKAVEDAAFAAAPEPFRAHPGSMLKWHPVERFGCASCHGGWGNALGRSEAHGELVGKGRPLLAGDRVQASCGKCHGESKELPGASMFLAGAQLFRTSGCLGCHKVESIENPNKAGPALDRVNEKVNPGWLVQWLKNPRSHSLEARMPSFGLDDEQARAIAAYLLTQNGTTPQAAPASIPEQTASEAAGNRLVKGLGCMGCHMIQGEGFTVGPELTNIRNKVRREWLYAWIQNPKAYLPNSRMPVFGLTREQAVQIGDYLLSVGKSRPPPSPLPASLLNSVAEQVGAKLIAERGCAGCHDIKAFGKLAAPELTHVADKTADLIEFGNAKSIRRTMFDWTVAKLQDPKAFDTAQIKARMPKFGLDETESQAIATYLMSLTADQYPPEYTKGARAQDTPLIAGRRIFADHNCAACHRIAGQGAKVGPELTREGEKVQPSWLFGFLERPERIRWWQDARMPNFHLSQAEATTLTEYLMELSNQPAPYEYTPPEQLIFPRAAEGAKRFIDLKCQSCHPLGGKQQVAGGDTKKLGPDLALAQRRLKADWMLRFFKDPQGFDPGTQMPTFKESDDTFRSMIDFLMKPGNP